jgi:membrane-associated phospholipid phosphatase
MEPANAGFALFNWFSLMLSLFKKNTAFFIPYLIFLLTGGIVLSLWSKIDIHLFINRHNCPLADIFFRNWTNFGLGIMIIPVAIILAFIRFRYMLISITGFLISGILNDSLKPIFHTPRPLMVFSQLQQPLYLVPHVEMLTWNGFPSGHTATGFCMFCLLALYSKNNFMKFLFFVVALLIGYSRMYLSEHFLQDVYGGSIIGICSAIFSYIWVMDAGIFNKFAERLDKPLIHFGREPK